MTCGSNGPEGFQLTTSYAGGTFSSGSYDRSGQWDSAVGDRPEGYVIEYRVALAAIDTQDGEGHVSAAAGHWIGFNVAVNDDDSGSRETQGSWDSWSGTYWSDVFRGLGTMYLLP